MPRGSHQVQVRCGLQVSWLQRVGVGAAGRALQVPVRAMLAARGDAATGGVVLVAASEGDGAALVHAIAQSAEMQGAVVALASETTVELGAWESIIPIDEEKVSQVFSNLLDNADKYSPGEPAIRLSTTNENGWFVATIEDKGVGISKTDQTRIFDRFYRVSSGNLHEVKGFGLGLSNVRDIAEAHGGSIEVKSAQGMGSTFILKLPV